MTHYRAFVRSGYHAVETICRVLICIWPGRKRREEKKWINSKKPLTPEWNCMQPDTCLGIGCVATTETTTAVECNCCNWGHPGKFDQEAYSKITIHSETEVFFGK